MLARILDESQPLGKDHDVVLETLAALGAVGSVDAIPGAGHAIQAARVLFGARRLRALKERSVDALVRIGTPTRRPPREEAGESGDRC